MTVSRQSFHSDQFNLSQAIGDRIVASDFYFEIAGNEGIALLMPNFSIPFVTTGEPIEVPLPLGQVHWQQSQLVTNFQGPVQFQETVAGHIDEFTKIINSKGGSFEARIYHGSPDDYYRFWPLRKCMLKLEPADVDFGNRSSLLNVSGSLSYHYFGDVKKGPKLLTAALR